MCRLNDKGLSGNKHRQLSQGNALKPDHIKSVASKSQIGLFQVFAHEGRTIDAYFFLKAELERKEAISAHSAA